MCLSLPSREATLSSGSSSHLSFTLLWLQSPFDASGPAVSVPVLSDLRRPVLSRLLPSYSRHHLLFLPRGLHTCKSPSTWTALPRRHSHAHCSTSARATPRPHHLFKMTSAPLLRMSVSSFLFFLSWIPHSSEHLVHEKPGTWGAQPLPLFHPWKVCSELRTQDPHSPGQAAEAGRQRAASPRSRRGLASRE